MNDSRVKGLLCESEFAALSSRSELAMKLRHPILGVAAIIFFSTFCAASSYCQLPSERWEHNWDNAMGAVGIDRAGDVYVSDDASIYCIEPCDGGIKWTGATGAKVIACDKANGIVTDYGDAYDNNGVLTASLYPGGTGVAIDSSGNVIFISGGTIKKYIFCRRSSLVSNVFRRVVRHCSILRRQRQHLCRSEYIRFRLSDIRSVPDLCRSVPACEALAIGRTSLGDLLP